MLGPSLLGRRSLMLASITASMVGYMRLGMGYSLLPRISLQLQTLTRAEYHIVVALAERLFRDDEQEGDTPRFPPAGELEVAKRLDALLENLDDEKRIEFGVALHFLEQAAPLRCGYISRFSKLDGEARDLILQSLESSSTKTLRGLFQALKSCCCLAYFSHPATFEAMGYGGPLVAPRQTESTASNASKRRLPLEKA